MHKTKPGFWLFSSYLGKYDDSPKIVSEYIHRFHPDIKIYWLIKKNIFSNVPSYVNRLDIDDKNDYEFGVKNAAVVIDNIMGPCCDYLYKGESITRKIKFKFIKFCHMRKCQRIYSFWHGIAFKKGMTEKTDLLIEDASFGNMSFLLGSEEMVNRFRRKTLNKGKKYLAIGSPRNDLLIKGSANKTEIKKELGLPIDKKIVLYAPTFRGNTKTGDYDLDRSGVNQLKTINVDVLLSSLDLKFGESFVLVVRLHHLVENSIDFIELTKVSDGRIFNGNACSNMDKYLLITDVLITDYSSSMSDFGLTKKPVFLFIPDYIEYKNKYGLIPDYDYLPFPKGLSFNELISTINNFDYDEYANRCQAFLDKNGYVLDSNSTERIVNLILNDK